MNNIFLHNLYILDTEWNTISSLRSKKSHLIQNKILVKSKTKVMFILFFKNEGVNQQEFVPAGQIVNGLLYVKILKRLREAIRREHIGK